MSTALDEHIVTVTDTAVEQLLQLRDAEPEGDRLGVRIEILADEGPDFTYDLSFQIVTKSDITDIVRTTNGLKVIVPAKDVTNLEGAVLDYEIDGLVLRNPNRPKAVQIGTLDHRRRGRRPGASRSSTPRSTRRSPPTAATSPSSATTPRAGPTSPWAAGATVAR